MKEEQSDENKPGYNILKSNKYQNMESTTVNDLSNRASGASIQCTNEDKGNGNDNRITSDKSPHRWTDQPGASPIGCRPDPTEDSMDDDQHPRATDDPNDNDDTKESEARKSDRSNSDDEERDEQAQSKNEDEPERDLIKVCINSDAGNSRNLDY